MATPAQAAFLAGLPQRPSGFNPYRNRDAGDPAPARRAAAHGGRRRAERQQAARGARRAPDVRAARRRRSSRRTSSRWCSRRPATPRPARIETTLDAALQADVAGIVESHRELLRRHGAANVAVVVLDNARGEWLAWEGSGDYFDAAGGGTINGPVTPRQPGSALKPFTYALAFEQGFSPASVLADVPSQLSDRRSRRRLQPAQLRRPLSRPAARARARWPDPRTCRPWRWRRSSASRRCCRFLERAGLTTFDKTAAHYGLGVTLGNAEVRLDELVAAYAAFARGGEWIAADVRRRVPPARRRARGSSCRRARAFWITDILVGCRGARVHLRPRRQPRAAVPGGGEDRHVAGVSRQLDDRLFAPRHGRRLGRQLRSHAAAQLERRHRRRADLPRRDARRRAARRRVVDVVLARARSLPPPTTTVQREICALSGLTANAWCPIRRREWVAAETPSLPCSWHHLSDEGLLTFWPARVPAVGARPRVCDGRRSRTRRWPIRGASRIGRARCA